MSNATSAFPASFPPASFPIDDAPSKPEHSAAAQRRHERLAWATTLAGCGVLLAGLAYVAPYLPGADNVPHGSGCRAENARLCR